MLTQLPYARVNLKGYRPAVVQANRRIVHKLVHEQSGEPHPFGIALVVEEERLIMEISSVKVLDLTAPKRVTRLAKSPSSDGDKWLEMLIERNRLILMPNYKHLE